MVPLQKLSVIIITLSAIMFIAASPATAADAPACSLSAQYQDEMIIVRVDDVTFTCYRFADGQKYPYFYPVNGPLSGESVTTESSLPYPHHRSLFFACDRVNAHNYWQEGVQHGMIVSRTPRLVKQGPDEVVIHDQCDWFVPGQPPTIADERTIVITAPSEDIRIIDFTITLRPQEDVVIQKTNHSLFSARMDPRLSVNGNGTLINSNGGMSQEGTVGKEAEWCDYYGTRWGMVEGLAICGHPDNIWYPSKWVTRDYGFFSPTELNFISEDEPFSIDGDDFITFKYRVIVHAGDTGDAGIAELHEEWITP